MVRVRLLTCGPKCHGELIQRMVAVLGEYKQVVDAATGLSHRVPTRDILEIGIKQAELSKYPIWEEPGVA